MPPPVAEQSGKTDLVRLPAAFVQRLRVIAQARRKTMGDVLVELAGSEIDTAYAAVIEAAASANELGNPVG